MDTPIRNNTRRRRPFRWSSALLAPIYFALTFAYIELVFHITVFGNASAFYPILFGIAGVLLCSTVPTLQPTTGSMPGIRAFTAAVFGGIGSMPGAMLGGILLGIIETLSKKYISTDFSDAIVFAVLIIILLLKPAGLLGKQVQEKV